MDKLPLRIMNRSVDDIRARNRLLEVDILNMVQLFDLYRRHVEQKLARAWEATNMGLDFLQKLGEEIEKLRAFVENSDDLTGSSLTPAREPSWSQHYRLEMRNIENSNGKFRRGVNPFDPQTIKIMDDLTDKKNMMMKEIQESQNSLNLILQYLSNYSTATPSQEGATPEEVLSSMDVEDMLEYLNTVFHSKSQGQDKSLRGAFKRIADLQKEFKNKDQEFKDYRAKAEEIIEKLRAEKSLVQPSQTSGGEVRLLKEQLDRMVTTCDSLTADKNQLQDSERRLKGLTTEQDTMLMRTRDELSISIQQLTLLRGELEEVKRALKERDNALIELETKQKQWEDTGIEFQQLRVAFIELQAGYQQLLEEYEQMKGRELSSQAMKTSVQTKIYDVELICKELVKKNQDLETVLQDQIERNRQLEDYHTKVKKELAEVLEENNNFRTKMLDKKRNKDRELDLSGSLDIGKIELEGELHKLRTENLELREDNDKLRYKSFGGEIVHLMLCQAKALETYLPQ